MRAYLSQLPTGKAVLWCYLIWYLTTVAFHFDPAPSLWLNSLGISAVIGVALMLSVSGPSAGGASWQTFRLFLMPFCVSSFSSLIKNQGFVLIFSPNPTELLACVLGCAAFLTLVWALHRNERSSGVAEDSIRP